MKATKLGALRATPSWEWPGDAADTLLDVLRDERAAEDDLLAAAELAGDAAAINDDLAAALLAVARGGGRSEIVRGAAALSLGPVLEEVDMDPDAGELPISRPVYDSIQEALRALAGDAGVPRDVRRSALEASVRAPQGWHQEAVRDAWASDDPLWQLTAVFCMRYVRGFDDAILAALDSADPDIQREAVLAAGTWEVDAAWPHVAAIVASEEAEKPLLLAAIEAAAAIRPDEAAPLLADLADSDDEEIAEAVSEALAMQELGELIDEESDDDEPL